MGRGRAKAKQTKVARDLKYRTWETDLDQLKRELSGDGQAGSNSNGDHTADDDEPDEYDTRRY
jgi:hypothetical protein